MKPLIAGNWKMNGLSASLGEIDRLSVKLGTRSPSDLDVVICPPATLIAAAAALRSAVIMIGGQDCHAKAGGAHTGDMSAEMLKDAGADFVILGHSERRADHQETDAMVRAKAEGALRAGLVPIICVGETDAQRRAGREVEVVGAQLAGSIPATAAAYVVAYEPVWAIGAGLTPSHDDIASMHAFIRNNARPGARILYGGSVKPSNAREILSLKNVDGALVGGASLKADEFFTIIDAAPRR